MIGMNVFFNSVFFPIIILSTGLDKKKSHVFFDIERLPSIIEEIISVLC